MITVTRNAFFSSFSWSRFRTPMLTAAGIATLALGVMAAGQQAGSDTRAGAVGSVDFVVVTRDGQPITDLKPEEVTLRVGNKNRVVSSLQYVKVAEAMVGAATPGAAPGAAVAAAKPDLPLAFFTNIATTGDTPRSFVVVVDDESMPIGQEPRLRTSLTNFVRDLPATDSVALITVPHGGLKVNLTTDRERLYKAIGELTAIKPFDEPSCRTRTTLATLETTLGQLARPSDQPVIVAFLSANLVGASTVEASARPTIGGGGVSAQGGSCYMNNDDFVRVGAALAVARAQFYVIHPDYSTSPVQDGIEHLRGQTGAPLFHLVSNTEPGLYRMARETVGYYVATFDTDPEERTGKALPAQIRTTRKEAEMRGRPYAVVGRTGAAVQTPAAVTPAATSTYDMVRSGKMFRELPLRATATSFRRADGIVNVGVLFEPVEPSVTIVSATAALIDESGKGIDYWNGEGDQLKASPTAVGLTVPPGNYRLRIAAIDSKGRTGVVDDRLVAEIGKVGPLQLSGLVLGVSAAGGGSGFTPRLQFSNEATAVAYVELYGVGEGAEVGAVFEIARTANGPALERFRGEFAATNEDGKFGVTAKIPIAALAAGDYVVRAMVGAAGQPSIRVIRTLKKVG